MTGDMKSLTVTPVPTTRAEIDRLIALFTELHGEPPDAMGFPDASFDYWLDSWAVGDWAGPVYHEFVTDPEVDTTGVLTRSRAESGDLANFLGCDLEYDHAEHFYLKVKWDGHDDAEDAPPEESIPRPVEVPTAEALDEAIALLEGTLDTYRALRRRLYPGADGGE